MALLIRSRGVPLLEQFIGLAAAEEFARNRGITITDADVVFEYELSLRRLSDPLAVNTTDFNKTEAEQLLDSILASRHMSIQEFAITARRNAILRRALTSDLNISEAQLRREYDLAYGERLQIRHIQVSSLADAMRIQERIAAGEDFADLASRYSTNATTARRGGLLDPFSPDDEHVALAMRQAAARLTPGQMSDVVRVGEWYHLLKFEKKVPAEQRDFESVRAALQKRLEVRLTDARMRELHEKLFNEATVQISDPLLREIFQAAHPKMVQEPSASSTEGN